MLMSGLSHHVGKYYGKYSGTVLDNSQDQDNMGSLVVSLPSLFGPDAQITARPCLPYGHFFIPAVGSAVWVEFEGGDKDYAIWVGTWYPQGTTPTPAAISPPDNRVIQTASGHTVEISDKDGDEHITIKHKGNAFISIDKKGSVLISNQNGSYVQLDADNKAVTFVEEHGNLVTMSSDGIVVAEKSGNTFLQLTDDTVRVTGAKIILQAPSISLTGDPAAEPTFLATSFVSQFWSQVLVWMGTHTHPTAMGPSGPAVPPPAALAIVPTAPFISSGTVLK
jgi:Type VI secretion system/phage-baseplate injector OB domain